MNVDYRGQIIRIFNDIDQSDFTFVQLLYVRPEQKQVMHEMILNQ